jgi:hypothetical protein
MKARFALGLLALLAASVCNAQASAAQEALPDLAGHFQQVCGTTGEGAPSLPGNDVAAEDAPSFFVGDLRRATESRLVKVGDRYAMRALVPSGLDPGNVVLVKCAVGSGSVSFAEQVDRLSAMLAARPVLGKTAQSLDYAQFIAGPRSFSVFSEPEGWVSIYRVEIMMRNVPRKYLKKGAKPVPAPSVR